MCTHDCNEGRACTCAPRRDISRFATHLLAALLWTVFVLAIVSLISGGR